MCVLSPYSSDPVTDSHLLRTQMCCRLLHHHGLHRVTHVERDTANVVLCPRRMFVYTFAARVVPPREGDMQGALPSFH